VTVPAGASTISRNRATEVPPQRGDLTVEWFLKALRQYSDFNGRARRQEYWMYQLFVGLIFLAIMVVFGGLAAATSSQTLLYLMMGVIAIVGVGLLVPSLAVTARRLHDTGRSGWWQLISLVPYVGGFVVLVFCILEGNRGPNRYGPDPKALPDSGTAYGYPAPGTPY
jgi:uncharacterized membrane protein YhaH (DUF805 family)